MENGGSRTEEGSVGCAQEEGLGGSPAEVAHEWSGLSTVREKEVAMALLKIDLKGG